MDSPRASLSLDDLLRFPDKFYWILTQCWPPTQVIGHARRQNGCPMVILLWVLPFL